MLRAPAVGYLKRQLIADQQTITQLARLVRFGRCAVIYGIWTFPSDLKQMSSHTSTVNTWNKNDGLIKNTLHLIKPFFKQANLAYFRMLQLSG